MRICRERFFVRLVSPQSQSAVLLIGTWVHMIKKTLSSICTTKMKQYTADEHYSLLGLFELRSLHFRFLDTEPMVLTLSSLQAQRKYHSYVIVFFSAKPNVIQWMFLAYLLFFCLTWCDNTSNLWFTVTWSAPPWYLTLLCNFFITSFFFPPSDSVCFFSAALSLFCQQQGSGLV